MPLRSYLLCVATLMVWFADSLALASDFSIHQLRVEARVEERLARTKMVLVVRNHTERPLEAHLDLALPTNASVTRSTSTIHVPLLRSILQFPRVHYAEHLGQTYFRVDLVPAVEAPRREDRGESPSGRFVTRLASAGLGHYASNVQAFLNVIDEPLIRNFRVESRLGAVEALRR